MATLAFEEKNQGFTLLYFCDNIKATFDIKDHPTRI